MRYFRGKGYSNEFVDNFYNMVNQLKSNPTIKVTNSSDIICGSCPHNKDNRCVKKPDSEAKVKEKDNRIIKTLGLSSGQEIKAEDAISMVSSRLDKLKETCKDCEWKEHCT